MSQSDSATRPLAGIRVLDCTRVLSGPICGRLLADRGADVVKVEPPETDIFRSTPPHVEGVATMYAHFNAGKRNVCVDLERAEGPELLADLACRADVLVENFRPGVMTRHGLGAKTLRSREPRLVYCSISGWGQEGPWATRPAYAPIVQAEAGLLSLGGALRRDRMQGEILQHADVYAGLMASNAILAALFQRERTGRGQHLDVAMGEALLFISEHAAAEIAGHEGSRGFETWTFESYALANGRSVHILGNPLQSFPLLAKALGLEALAADPRFETLEAREQHRSEMVGALAERIARIPTQGHLEDLLEGLPAVVTGVRTTRELVESEWGAARGVVTEVAKGLSVPSAAWRSLDGAPVGVSSPRVARRGEDNQAVLAEWLGMGAETIGSLEAKGVLEFSETEPPSLAEAPRKAFRRPSDRPSGD